MAKSAALGSVWLLYSLAGCSSPAFPDSTVQNPATLSQVQLEATSSSAQDQHNPAIERLAKLWERRTHEQSRADYPIGPGDVLEISIPGVDELQGRSVRVSGEGTISLPLVGELQAAGHTEEALREAIHRRLTRYMYNPLVDIFVKEYRSRQVAVIGAVAKPGVYDLASDGDTVLRMVGLAGGMREEAAQRILLIAANPVDTAPAKALAGTLPAQLATQNPSPLILKQMNPLVIDLQNLSHGEYQMALSLPARPGDVIIVPVRGQVLVQGWVERPGPYTITPGLTVLGAVAAAGGPMFAADTSAVQLIRTAQRGEKIASVVDLQKIKNGQMPDIALQEGDVIDVVASSPKLVPYGIYSFFTGIFHVGAGASVPMR